MLSATAGDRKGPLRGNIEERDLPCPPGGVKEYSLNFILTLSLDRAGRMFVPAKSFYQGVTLFYGLCSHFVLPLQ